jgi:diguanylate cyclase (GGDEF)-like protein/putative nucleotidyltransferase with HDIG domain
MLPARLNSNDTILKFLKQIKEKPTQTNDIIVVKIDESTLNDTGKKWIADREFTAQLINKISHFNPKIIAIDLILFGKSTNPDEDEQLAQAIKNSRNIILPSIISENGEYIKPYKMFLDNSSGEGFVNRNIDPDYRIRKTKLIHKTPSTSETHLSFETIIASVYRDTSIDNIKDTKETITINGHFIIPLDKNGSIFINFLPIEYMPSISAIDLLNDKIKQKNILENKIVLVGVTSKTSHDAFQTEYGIMPGVFVNAMALNTILTKNFIQNIPNTTCIFGILVMILMTGFFIYKVSAPKGLMFFFIEILLIFSIFHIAFLKNFKFDYFSVLFLCILSYTVANIYKYSYLLYFSNKLKSMAIKDSATGVATGRYFQFKLQLDLSRAKDSNESISIVIFTIPEFQDLSKKYSREQTGVILDQIGLLLKQNSRKKVDLLARWKEDKFSAILPRTDIKEASIYSQKIISKIEENEFISSEGTTHLKVFVGISNYPTVKTDSAASLISCAEAASTRAKLSGQKLIIFNPQQDKVQIDILKRKTLTSETEYLTLDIEEREKELLNTLEELKKSHQEIQKAHLETILSLVKALEEKDPYTAGHSERVANYAVGIAKQMALDENEVNLIKESALLHDIGKFGMPDAILHKKEALNADDIEQIHKHPVMSARILEKSKFFESHIPLIMHHHEKFDGKGYPHGLSGKFIPRGAQIISIADSLDAMTTGRGYNRVLNIDEAIQELKKSEGKQFDPDYIKIAIDYLLGRPKS